MSPKTTTHNARQKRVPRELGLFVFSLLILCCNLFPCCSSRNTGAPVYHQSGTKQNTRSPLTFAGDTILMARVKSKFISDDMVNDDGIHVKVRHGVVYLDGWTTDEYERRMALDLARSVDGVVRVVNNLKLTNQGTVFTGAKSANSDTQIKKQITMALLNDPEVSSQPVTVLVTPEQVVLSGLVENTDQRRRAEAIAAAYAGQRKLSNQIQARP